MLENIKTAVGERLLTRLLPSGFLFRRNGYCPCCRSNTEFRALDPWLRDHFRCRNCGSIPRQRALMVVLERLYPDWRELRIHEAGPTPGGASALLAAECPGYVASQYRPDMPFGAQGDGFRNEDLERQTFADESFDLVVTQDVMEHIYDPQRAFSEIARTLRPGGAHIFSVPLVNLHRPSERWAARDSNGQPRFLCKPDYHGLPGSDAYYPVTWHWGFDICGHIERACRLQTTIEVIDDLNQGIRANLIEILVTHKSVDG